MATIRNAIHITDGMSPALRNMSRSLDDVIQNFEGLQRQSSQAIDNNSIKQARDELNRTGAEFDRIEREIHEAGREQKQFNRDIRDGEKNADGLGNKIKSLVGAYAVLHAARKSKAAAQDWMAAADLQTQAETQLATVMGQRMGTVDIEAVLDITSAQQSAGVLGDEIQLMGAQQVATFLETEDALHALIPAMNNLAVQQKGVNATSQDMVNIGNMMGKVMQGQVGALTRVGISFTEAEEAVLKYGTEAERAAMLAQVIENNVGNMNEVMAATPQGQIQQMRNAWGDVHEMLGYQIYPAVMRVMEALTNGMGSAEHIMMAFAGGIAFALDILVHLINGAVWLADVIANNWSWIQPVIVGITGALIAYKVATMAMTVAQWALNAAMSVNPIMLLVMAVAVIIGALYKWVQANGGLRASIMTLQHYSLVAWDGMRIGATWMVNKVLNGWDNMRIGTRSLSTGIQNIFGDMRAGSLSIIESMVNGAINLINKMIKAVNKVPGVSISAIEAVTFGTEAQIQNEAEKQARNAALDEYRSERQAERDARDQNLADMIEQSRIDAEDRRMKIDQVRADAEAKDREKEMLNLGADFDQMHNELESIDHHTAGIKDAVTMTAEDLKYLKDLAEQEVINRFTTAEVKVEMKNDMQVSSNMDLDGVVTYLEDKLTETLQVVAEGVPVGV